MANKRGWWKLDVGDVVLSDGDREHIANLITVGYTEGEIIKDQD